MSEIYYAPLKLNQTNRYPGYQFHARVRIDGMPGPDVFRYVVLTVYDWLLKKVPEEDRKAPELQVPAPEEYGKVGPDTFSSFHLNIGFALDITPLPDQGIWALRIKETDSGAGERPAVVGRFFTTRVGVRLTDKGDTELGILVDVTDPAAYRKVMSYLARKGFSGSDIISVLNDFSSFEEGY